MIHRAAAAITSETQMPAACTRSQCHINHQHICITYTADSMQGRISAQQCVSPPCKYEQAVTEVAMHDAERVTDLEPCRKPAFTAADIQTTQDSFSSSRAPPATALDCWLPPGDASKGLGCTKVPPEGLVSKPVELARAGGAAASCPVPQEQMSMGCVYCNASCFLHC